MVPPLHNQLFLVSEFIEVAYEYPLDFFYTFGIVCSDIKGEVGSRGRHAARAERERSEPGGQCVFRFDFMPEMAAQLADVSACRFGGDGGCCCVHVSQIIRRKAIVFFNPQRLP